MSKFISHKERVRLFGDLPYVTIKNPNIPNSFLVVVNSKWRHSNIVLMDIPQLNDILNGKKKYINRKIHRQLQAVFEVLEHLQLMDRILTFNGTYVPRFKKGRNGSRGALDLSNHSWGTAIDLNAKWNGFGVPPAKKGTNGSLEELVDIFLDFGFLWGGLWGTPDGMHFEAERILTEEEIDLVKAKYLTNH